jgi:hypothetical protein
MYEFDFDPYLPFEQPWKSKTTDLELLTPMGLYLVCFYPELQVRHQIMNLECQPKKLEKYLAPITVPKEIGISKKVEMMTWVQEYAFSYHNPIMREALLESQGPIVYYTRSDPFWGVMATFHKDGRITSKGGDNRLGIIIQSIRDRLVKESRDGTNK